MTNRVEANLALVQRFYECYAAGDLDTMREEIFAPNIEWHIPGRHPLSGRKQGAAEVVAFFDELAKSRFKAETYYLGADDNYVVDVHRGWSERNDGTDIDLTWVLVYRIEEGRMVEVRDFAEDQALADEFFWRNYPLTSIPDRLAQ